jgi:hypothetical protein
MYQSCHATMMHMSRWFPLWAYVLSIPFLAYADQPPAGVTGLQKDVVFNEYSPLSRNAALAQRLLTPLTSAEFADRATRLNLKVREYPVDLANEKFDLFVPVHAPPQGYSLLVFIEPWTFTGVPSAWLSVLERHGMIFATAQNSGNTESVYERRIPLALIAAYNVTQRYPVDHSRVYIGGISGGSRVAQRMALAYPDIFRSALLHSSSDPIGIDEVPLPTPELFRQFQESTRLVFITGQNDTFNLEKDKVSRASLESWCVFDIAVVPFPLAGHELAGGRQIEPALAALDEHTPPKPRRLEACRAHVEKELRANLQQTETLIGRGNFREASALLKKIDSQFAGLSAPQSLDLAKQIAAAP